MALLWRSSIQRLGATSVCFSGELLILAEPAVCQRRRLLTQGTSELASYSGGPEKAWSFRGSFLEEDVGTGLWRSFQTEPGEDHSAQEKSKEEAIAWVTKHGAFLELPTVRRGWVRVSREATRQEDARPGHHDVSDNSKQWQIYLHVFYLAFNLLMLGKKGHWITKKRKTNLPRKGRQKPRQILPLKFKNQWFRCKQEMFWCICTDRIFLFLVWIKTVCWVEWEGKETK